MKETILVDINIFIASPTDTSTERQKINRYINERWNLKFGSKINVRLNTVMWENKLASMSGIEIQKAIDEFLLEKCDILVGIFWKKFGIELSDGVSATVHEIENFVNSKKPVILYFSNKSLSPEDIDENEMRKIKEFKKNIPHKAYIKILNPKGC